MIQTAAREYIAERLQALDGNRNPLTPIFTEWDYVSNYYGEEYTPRNDNDFPSME